MTDKMLTKQEMIFGWVDRQEIEIVKEESWSPEELRCAAIDNAHQQRAEYEDRSAGEINPDWEVSDVDRAVVNFLRHNLTNYDELLESMNEEFSEPDFDERLEKFQSDWWKDWESSQGRKRDDLTQNEEYDLDEQCNADFFDDDSRELSLSAGYERLRDRVQEALQSAFPEYSGLIANCEAEASFKRGN